MVSQWLRDILAGGGEEAESQSIPETPERPLSSWAIFAEAGDPKVFRGLEVLTSQVLDAGKALC